MGTARDEHSDIALTFDDGPNPATTLRVLEILARHEIKAVFFVVGNMMKDNDERCGIVKHAHEMGHGIGNHTFSHLKLPGRPRDVIKAEILKAHNLIVDCVGACELFRAPYGATSQLVDDVVQNDFHYTHVMWDVDTEDWKLKSEGKWVENAMKQIKAREDSLVLLHDIHESTVGHLEGFITRIKEVSNVRFVLANA